MVISQESDVTDPKCGISNISIPHDRIHLAGVPGLKSKILGDPPCSLWEKNLEPQELGWFYLQFG